MGNQLSFQNRLFRSLFDMRFYLYVLKEKTSKAVMYGIMMALFFGSLSSVRVCMNTYNEFDMIHQVFDANLKPFSLVNGELQSENKEPYVFKDQGVAIGLDPYSELPEMDQDVVFGYYLLKKEFAVFQNIDGKPVKFFTASYDQLFPDGLNKEILLENITAMRNMAWIHFLLSFIPSLIYLVISVLLTMLFGSIVYISNGKRISARNNMVIALYGNTLVGLMTLISFVFQIYMPASYPIAMMIISFIYMYVCRTEDMPQA